MLVKPEIRKPEDLKGKKVASSGLGSLGDFLYRVIMRKYGTEPGQRRDLDHRRHAAGTASGARVRARWMPRISPIHPTLQGEKMGYRVLWDARVEVPYPSMSVVTREKNHSRRPRYRDAYDARPCRRHSLSQDAKRKPALKILAKYLRTNDRELLGGLLRYLQQRLHRSCRIRSSPVSSHLRVGRAAPAGNQPS